MNKPKIGLLPLYLELYDKSCADRRPMVEQFYRTIAAELEKGGASVITSGICRLKKEFASAVRSFEKQQADAIVTLHLAYSPSLESSDVLAGTCLPLIVLDTTPAYAFSPGQNPKEIMYNHGIHGVQDMCNLLIRNGKPFRIEAGHWQRSDVLDRVISLACAAKLAASMRRARVGIIGSPFKGMGDFAVPSGALARTIGVTTVPCDMDEIRKTVAGIGAAALKAEVAAIVKSCGPGKLENSVLRRSALAGLAVRRWIEAEKLTAFTFNFLAINKASGLPTVPFIEACLAMSRGIGYAGEGDILTAALVGSLLALYPDTTFAEMFCPDWKNNGVFLSHMGEINTRLVDGKPRLCAPPFPYTDAELPVKLTGRLKGGKACFVNLAPMPAAGGKRGGFSYRLIVASGSMLAVRGSDAMKDSVRGWFMPTVPLADFLADYSRNGGTHHAALVYGDRAREIVAFGGFMGWETVVL